MNHTTEMLKVREAEIACLKEQMKELKEAMADMWVAHVKELNQLMGQLK